MISRLTLLRILVGGLSMANPIIDGEPREHVTASISNTTYNTVLPEGMRFLWNPAIVLPYEEGPIYCDTVRYNDVAFSGVTYRIHLYANQSTSTICHYLLREPDIYE